MNGASPPTARPAAPERAAPSERAAPDRAAPSERAAPDRAAPSERAAAPERAAPSERAAPDRAAPSERAAPERAAVPPRAAAPERAGVPPRAAPDRAAAPERAAAPPHAAAPDRAAVPPRAAAPECAAVPPRAAAPDRAPPAHATAPDRAASSQAARPPSRHPVPPALRRAARRCATSCLALTLAIAPALAPPARAADPPVEAPAAVAELLARVQDAAARSDPPAALAAVDAWTGPAHPLVDLARGHAYALADRLDPAITAYRAALAAEPTLRPAGLGLIAALARREHWPALTTELPRWHDPASADAPTMRLWLAAALGAEDATLAEEIARRALVRWPDESRFRRGLAHALLVTDRPAAAAAVIRRLIAAEPADPALWQQLAQAAPDAVTRRAALEAAVLAEPTDRPRRAHLVEALLAAGHAPAALTYARPLGATPLAIRAAVAADATEQAAAWLAAIPAADRDPALRRLAARVALARGDRATARAELAALLAADAADVTVLVQLAALERDAGALDRAEALLRQGAAAPGPEAGLAVAWLAHLLLRRGRRDEAAALLRRHLTAWPADTTARALLTAAEG